MATALGAPVDLHDAITIRYDNGAIGTVSGASSHLGAHNNKHQLEVHVVGSEGQFVIDLDRAMVWRYRNPADNIDVPIAPDAGAYNCQGPIDALVDLALGRDARNCSPIELGARTVEILDAAYRSARSGRVEQAHAD
jgi:hypothetical protein